MNDKVVVSKAYRMNTTASNVDNDFKSVIRFENALPCPSTNL